MSEQDPSETPIQTPNEELPAKNLKHALFGLGFAILASLAFYYAMDSIGPRTGRTLAWVMFGLYSALTIASGFFAFLACWGSIKSLNADKNVRNYIALVIGGLLLIEICRELINLL